MTESGKQLTLDNPAVYQIQVPGVIDFSNADWIGDVEWTVEGEAAGAPVTLLTGKLDQAALHGLLRRLYGYGLPIISVKCIDAEVGAKPASEPD